MSSRVLGSWVVVVGLVVFGRGASAAPPRSPPALLATVAIGPDHTLDALRALANGVQPGLGGMLTPELIRDGLRELAGATTLDGLDATASTYVLVIDRGRSAEPAMAVVAKVRDELALRGGLGAAHATIKAGWAVIGPRPVVARIAGWALATLPSRPVVAAPEALVYVTRLHTRFRKEFAEVRQKMIGQMSTAPGTGQMAGFMTAYVEGLFSAAAETDQLRVTLDATQNAGAIEFAFVARPRSRLAKFIAAQRASSYGLLATLPAQQGAMVLAGHLDGGPYRDGLIAMVSTMLGNDLALVAPIRALMKVSTGEVAMAFQIGAGKPAQITQLIGLADATAADAAIDLMLRLLAGGRTIDAAGVPATIVPRATPIIHDGVSIKGYDTTYDLSKAPVATRQVMQQMYPGTTTTNLAVIDHQLLLTVGGDPKRSIDAARGKTSRLALSPTTDAFVAGARGRKDSLVMVLDLAAITAKPGPARPLMMAVGFVDRTARLRISLPAATLRALVGRP